jgi:hypothetical protein
MEELRSLFNNLHKNIDKALVKIDERQTRQEKFLNFLDDGEGNLKRKNNRPESEVAHLVRTKEEFLKAFHDSIFFFWHLL